MARVCVSEREKKRRVLAASAADKRTALKSIIKNVDTDFDDKVDAIASLNNRSREESSIRQRRRCRVCSRPRGVLRKFGICRLCVRKVAMKGLIPGLRKASW